MINFIILSDKTINRHLRKIGSGASQRRKKNFSGSISNRRDLIGSETLPLPIYKNEMLPSDQWQDAYPTVVYGDV